MKLVTKILLGASAVAAAAAVVLYTRSKKNEKAKVIPYDEEIDLKPLEPQKEELVEAASALEEEEEQLEMPLPAEEPIPEVCPVSPLEEPIEEEIPQEEIILQEPEEIIEEPAEEPVEEEIPQEEETIDEEPEEIVDEPAEEPVEEEIPQEEEIIPEEPEEIIDEPAEEPGEEEIPQEEETIDEEPVIPFIDIEEDEVEDYVDEEAAEDSEPVDEVEKSVAEQLAEEARVEEEIESILEQTASLKAVIDEAYAETDAIIAPIEPTIDVETYSEEIVNDVVDVFSEEDNADAAIDDTIENIINSIEKPEQTTEELIQSINEEMLDKPDAEAVEEAAAEDLEAIDETFLDESPIEEIASVVEEVMEEEVDENDLPVDELVEKYSQNYPAISTNMLNSIVKQVMKMQDIVGSAENIEMRHHIVFKEADNRQRYCDVASVQGLKVQLADNDSDLYIYNTVENSRKVILPMILALVTDASEYHGSYRGWRII